MEDEESCSDRGGERVTEDKAAIDEKEFMLVEVVCDTFSSMCPVIGSCSSLMERESISIPSVVSTATVVGLVIDAVLVLLHWASMHSVSNGRVEAFGREAGS